MTCERITLPDGTTAIVCSRGRRRARCGWCSAPHTLLCDHPTKPGKTCSKRLCVAHAQHVEELDLCPEHARRPEVNTEAHEVGARALKVYTSRIWLRGDPDTFDITRGNGGEAAAPFAPSKAILLPALAARTRAKTLSDAAARAVLQVSWAAYTASYQAEMRLSYGALRQKKWAELGDLERAAWAHGVRPRRAAWDDLLVRERVVLTCYCTLDPRWSPVDLLARGQCHRVLLAGYLAACGAVYMGEIALPKARAA